MKPTPFDPAADLPPLCFEEPCLRLAAELKEAGLEWKPHVGCFVWDPEGSIVVDSPFPARVYFILNLGRFLQIFGSIEEMKKKLVWLPTWFQARLLCQRLGIQAAPSQRRPAEEDPLDAAEELASFYGSILGALKKSPR
jgi:hypothetical protein